jgi:acyl-CoA dehydrogenase
VRRQDLPPEVWQFIKDKGFLGMIIPKEYGGKGFSAFAHSQVVTKLSTRSSAAAVTVMVPNSLGPAELLLHYGTRGAEATLPAAPRARRGDPCFALTSPGPGPTRPPFPTPASCARAVAGRGSARHAAQLGQALHHPGAGVHGVRARVQALRSRPPARRPRRISASPARSSRTDHPGVEIGRRHLPLNAPFQNGPDRGKDVFMPLDFIIGGPGWPARAGAC